MEIKRFDLLEVELSGAKGSEQDKVRPCVVIQNDIGNRFSPTTLVMPLTHVIKNLNQPTHALIKLEDAIGLRTDSMIVAEQTRTVDKCRIIKKIGGLTSDKAKEEAIKVYFANVMGEKYIPDSMVCLNGGQ